MLIESRAKNLASVVANHDGTPMRLDTGGNVIQSDEVIVRLLKSTNAWVSMKRSPISVKPLQLNATGVIPALKTAGWGARPCNASGSIDKVKLELFRN